MNNVRRKQLKKAITFISTAKDIIEEVQNDEQDAFDNLPEGLQYSERGGQMEENVDSLDEVIEELDDIVDVLDSM